MSTQREKTAFGPAGLGCSALLPLTISGWSFVVARRSPGSLHPQLGHGAR